MGLSKEAIKEFKEEISDTEAQEMAESLITLFKIIYHPIPKNKDKNGKDFESH